MACILRLVDRRLRPLRRCVACCTSAVTSSLLETPTNQQFVILPNEDMARIREHASIEYWEKYDETHTVVRFCTSWATTQEDIDALAAVL